MGAAARERNARCRPPDRPQPAVAGESVCAPIRANDALPREKKLADGRFAQRTAEVHRAVRRELQDSLTRSVPWVTPVRPVPLRAPRGLAGVPKSREDGQLARPGRFLGGAWYRRWYQGPSRRRLSPPRGRHLSGPAVGRLVGVSVQVDGGLDVGVAELLLHEVDGDVGGEATASRPCVAGREGELPQEARRPRAPECARDA